MSQSQIYKFDFAIPALAWVTGNISIRSSDLGAAQECVVRVLSDAFQTPVTVGFTGVGK
jgi:hypothetical protein